MSSSLHPDSRSAVYCPGCNARFLLELGELGCPRCGAAVPETAPAPHGPTLLWKAGPQAPSLNQQLVPDEDHDMRTLVGGRLGIYDCEALLGRGGMGWVFLARHRDLHRSCALKLLAPRLLSQDAEYLNRFHNEGRAAAALIHPNIVTTHAIGRVQEFHYLEMEFVPGRALQQRIETGPLTPMRATHLAMQVASGLAAAHRSSILHRDLKPDNILLTHAGVPKIADFGLAKRVVSVGHSTPRSDELAGTPNYMAPELFAGYTATPAADVYALGVCYFQMLTGRLPFTRPRLTDLIAAVSHEQLPKIRDLRPEVSLEMAECAGMLMSPSPANRPADGTEALQLLQAVLGEARDLDTLLSEALEGLTSVSRTQSEEVHLLDVQLPDGRRQVVFVEETRDRCWSGWCSCSASAVRHRRTTSNRRCG